MKAITANDICYSTVRGTIGKALNTDGKERDFIDLGEARAALDFEIAKYPSYDERGNILPGHYHLRRVEDGAFIPCPAVGDKFVPVQHRDVFDYITGEIAPAVPGMKFETVGTLYGLGTALVTATMGDDFHLPGDDSPHRTRLLFTNPCGRGSLVIGFTSVRIFCQNCLAAARRDAIHGENGFSIRHTSGATMGAKAAIDCIARQLGEAADLRARCERLCGVEVNKALLDRALDRVYPLRFEEGSPARGRIEAKRDEVVAQFVMGETARTIRTATAWRLLNAFTYPLFNPSRLGERADLADVSYRGQLGGIAGRVRDIFDTVEEVALAA